MTVPAAGRVSARLARGRKVVASGASRASAAGRVKVALKLRAGVRPRRLRGRTLALRVVWTGASGGSAVATAKLKAR